MSPVDPVEFGRHSAQLDALHSRMCHVEEVIESMNTKLDSVLMTLAERRGERRFSFAAIGFLGTLVGTFVSWLLHKGG